MTLQQDTVDKLKEYNDGLIEFVMGEGETMAVLEQPDLTGFDSEISELTLDTVEEQKKDQPDYDRIAKNSEKNAVLRSLKRAWQPVKGVGDRIDRAAALLSLLKSYGNDYGRYRQAILDVGVKDVDEV